MPQDFTIKGDAPGGSAGGAAAAASAAIAGGGSIASSLIGYHSAKQQRKFQERMSNTSHQREMADLKKSGLNPLLTGKYGGSSTPPGTSFTPENPLSKVTETYSQVKMLKANLANLRQSTLTNSAIETKSYKEGYYIDAKKEHEQAATKLLNLQTNSAQADSDMWELIQEYGKGGKALSPAFQILLNRLLKQRK